MKRYSALLGIALCSLYLVAGLYSFPCFDISVEQKNDIVARMENAESAPEACGIARPFISATFNLTHLGARFLALSLFVTGGNLVLFILVHRGGRKAGVDP
jgi:hypothetical protein